MPAGRCRDAASKAALSSLTVGLGALRVSSGRCYSDLAAVGLLLGLLLSPLLGLLLQSTTEFYSNRVCSSVCYFSLVLQSAASCEQAPKGHFLNGRLVSTQHLTKAHTSRTLQHGTPCQPPCPPRSKSAIKAHFQLFFDHLGRSRKSDLWLRFPAFCPLRISAQSSSLPSPNDPSQGASFVSLYSHCEGDVEQAW